MFGDYVFRMSSAEYANRILLVDVDHLEESTDYSAGFLAHGFEVVRYTDDLHFRIDYEEKLKAGNEKIAVIAESEQYIPYDLRRRLTAYAVSLSKLFPRLNADVLRGKSKQDLDLICYACEGNYDKYRSKAETEQFLRLKVYQKENVRLYLESNYKELLARAKAAAAYRDWFAVAEEKATIDSMAVRYEIDFDTSEVNFLFRDYIFSAYGKLSTSMDNAGPVLVSRAMEFMKYHSSRFVIIVMDGMSEFDWSLLAQSFDGIRYQKASAFAMIPTVTSVSRQCLLSNKYPSQLLNPWSQSKEKQEFIECAKKMGFAEKQIAYERGYDADFGPMVRCAAVIINDIDDMVHGQKQGRIGMFNDVGVMAKQRKLADMTRRFLKAGFDVYITADHGNTTRRGMGKLMGTGVEMETKSRCMLVLKGFADKDGLKEKYGLLEFPKTYLPKEYDYLICDVGDSFDAKGEDVMSHGGISIDEGIVPFIKIKAVENNG